MYLAMAKAGTIYVINDDAYFIQDTRDTGDTRQLEITIT